MEKKIEFVKQLTPTNRALCIAGVIALGLFMCFKGEYSQVNMVIVGLFALVNGDH